MFDETRQLFDYYKTLTDQERGLYTTWLVVSLIKDVAYYIVVGLVVWSLGRRLITAFQAGLREARRERA